MINMRLTSSKQPERNSAARAPAPLRRQHRLPRFHRQAVLATKRRRPPHRFHSLRIRLLPRLVPGINLNPACLIARPLVSRQSFLVPFAPSLLRYVVLFLVGLIPGLLVCSPFLLVGLTISLLTRQDGLAVLLIMPLASGFLVLLPFLLAAKTDITGAVSTK